MHGSDRRRAHRVSLGSVDVRLSAAPGSLIDLSVLGALVNSPVGQVQDADITFEMQVRDLALKLRARVVRSEATPAGYRIALEFAEPSMDELVRLSRLIEDHKDATPAPAPVSTTPPTAWWA